MRRLILAILLLLPIGARAQGTSTVTGTVPAQVPAASLLASSCVNSGISSLASGAAMLLPCDSTGKLAVSATVSATATISGFAPASVGTPIAATTGGATGTLPAGAVVVATNVGATNGAYCALGGSSSTSQQYIAPGGGWFAFTVGSATQLTCVTSTSTTTVNTVGGSGLPTGIGGAGSGGGGGGGNATIVGPLGSTTSPSAVSVVIASDQVAVSVKQATAANLNATVVGAGTAASPSSGVVTTAAVPSAAASVGITAIVSSSAEATHVLKGGAGNLYSVYVTTGATAGYLLVFNATAAPADGSVTPLECLQVPAGQTMGFSWGSGPPAVYSTGISVAFSTTGCFTKTASATAFFRGAVQ